MLQLLYRSPKYNSSCAKMELLSDSEMNIIVKQCGYKNVLNWAVEDFSNKIIGYLGDHLNLTVQVQINGVKSDLKLFIKCTPRFDKWKANYINELGFFMKEFIMLSGLFKKFQDYSGERRQWRPKLVYIREDLFVFENVAHSGYKMPNHLNTMTFDKIIATVKSLSRFHAESLIFEEKKSKEIGKLYRIWDDYSDFLQEPNKSEEWRRTGLIAIIDFLKQYSRYKFDPDFIKKIETIIPMLFDGAMDLMKPNFSFRNVVVHRDMWSNNIFLKKQENGKYHALIIDFQTVLYCSPMIDLCSVLYFNTTKLFRKKYTNDIIDVYYETLAEELSFAGLDVSKIYDKTTLIDLYESSRMFGLTQAAIIVPIIAMTSEKRKELFLDTDTAQRFNTVSRSKEFIDFAKEDERYHTRVIEIFDEIVEKYIYPNRID